MKRNGMLMQIVRQRGLLTAVLFLTAMQSTVSATGQDTHSIRPDWAGDSIIDVPTEELTVRLIPLELDTITMFRDELMKQLRVNATGIADTIIDRQRLSKSGDADPEQIDMVGQRTISLMIEKEQLVSRVRAVLAAIEVKGGDTAGDRAYLEAVVALRPDLTQTVTRADRLRATDPTTDETTRARVSELVAMVRAERPAHERDTPWQVPVDEFELELRPLTTEQILGRLESWRQLLQEQVRIRIRMDILLNDSDKLEQSIEVRNRAAALVGLPAEDVAIDDLKAVLVAQVEEQQQIILAITDRMKAAIEIAKRRGGDAQPFVDYIASSTGRKLNFSDLTVLRAQLIQWTSSPSGGRMVLRNVIVFFAIIVAFWLLGRAAGLVTRYASRRIPRSSTLLGPVLAGIVEKVTIIIGVVIAAGAVGVDTGPLLAMIGATGLVIGLALQGTLSNFASGILILLNRPFDVGDVVDAGGVFGKVEAMNLVSTTVLTFDNQLMLVPNNQIWNSVITNVTGKNTRRVDLTFGVAYSSDLALATSILEDVMHQHPKTLE
ncbi:MAG: mechanosensitive ion channel family protein, partial [Planctomycetota bacterium]